MNPSDYATVQNAMTRMVVPMRREFGVALDVPRLRSDIAYAQFIVAQALAGRDPALVHSAQVVDHWLQAALARRAAPPQPPQRQARAFTCEPSTVTF